MREATKKDRGVHKLQKRVDAEDARRGSDLRTSQIVSIQIVDE